MKIRILGTEYNIYHKNLKEDSYLNGVDGYIDTYNKTITYRHYVEEDREEDTLWPLIENENKALRHELIHAFLFESGLSVNSNYSSCWATNEEMVDWIAIQMPKIMEAYESITNPVNTVDVSYVDSPKETIQLTGEDIRDRHRRGCL